VLLLTVSRGALLGLALGVAITGYLAWRRRTTQRWRPAADLLFVALGIAAAVAGVFLLSRSTLLDNSITSRPQLWRWAMDLIADYPFTGSGLGSTMMVHATYLLILHVGFIPHMHNLFLQIGVEQGIPGIAAFLALLLLPMANLLMAYQRRGSLWLIGGAVVALSVLLVHGAVDAVPYHSRLAFVTFVPLGFALGVTPRRRARSKTHAASPRPTLASAALAAAFLLVASLAVIAFTRQGQAALQANLGAVAQTRAELAPYTWPEWPIQDALRRSPEIDLGPAVARYQAALASDPRQASANRRLGQIELSQGAYDAARLHLETAYQESPQRHANRYLLGESYAVAGQEAEAVELWRSVSSQLWWEEDWLARAVVQGREYWYDSIGEPQRAEALRRVRAQLEAGSTP
jgi:tetratricopeptide (TPR) repeat protein